MGLDFSKLEKVRHHGSKTIARCPACAEAGSDRKGEHLFIEPGGRFGCVVYPGPDGQKHRQRIFELTGIKEKTQDGFKVRKPLSLIDSEKKSLRSILENLPANSIYWWSKERAEYLLNQMSEKHRSIADKMIAGNETTYGTVFRRVRHGKSMAELRTDGISGCLRTPRGGSGRQILFVAGKGRYAVRLLTPRECARLMGADDFKITVSLNQALFGFGDAVCVPVIQWIAENYLTPEWKEINAVEITKERYAASAI